MAEDITSLVPPMASDEHQAFVDQAALVAALEALKDYDPRENSPKRMVRHILQAFAAAFKIGRAAKFRIESQFGGYVHLDIRHIVASAVHGRHFVPAIMPGPHSVGGAELVAFASACVLLEARSTLETLLDCEGYGDVYAAEVLQIFKVDDEDEE